MRKSVILLMFAAAPLFAQTVDVPPATPAARSVKAAVESLDGRFRSDVRNFYASAGYRMAWQRNGRAVVALLGAASEKGLDPADYRLPQTTDDAHFDVALTAAVMRYASDLHSGRIDPRALGFDLDAGSRRLYLPALAAAVSQSSDPAPALAAAEPQSDDYRALLRALAQYRRIAAEAAGDQPLPIVPAVRPGDAYAALPQLATTLRRLGDLPAEASVSANVYDDVLVAAVKHFQARHGLAADGILSGNTFAALNVPASQRVAQIEWALERSRWTATDQPSIVVNIPEFRLRARDGNDVVSMRVVVGKAAGHQTPLLEGDVRTVVFRPSWNVPPKIQRNEIVPKLARDPQWLARHGFEIVDDGDQSLGSDVDDATVAQLRSLHYHVRQKPGAGNALGVVKFVFPNQNDIYLHDSPQQSLYARARRDFSHGCVRVEDPVALAAWALRESPAKVRTMYLRGKATDQWVRLERPVRVMIVYATAAVSDDGQVEFFNDIYGHDAALAAALHHVNPSPAGSVLVAAK